MLGPAVRTAEMSTIPYRAGSDIEIGCSNKAHEVRAVLLSSADGRWCIEAGVLGANMVIRVVRAGVPGSAVTNAAGDEPTAAPCSAAHGLPAGNAPFWFRVRFVNNTIYLYLNGSETELLRHELLATDFANDFEYNRYVQHRHWGFVSAINGAKVTYAKLFGLESVVSERADWMAIVGGGSIYVVRDDTGPFLVRAGVFPTSGPISMTAYAQHVYMVGGGKAIDLDLSDLSITPWGGTTATTALPGASETAPSSGIFIAGTTRMTIVGTYLDRVTLGGDPQDPQNKWYSAIGDANDWDTAAINSPGRAFAFGASFPGRVGEPILGFIQSSKTTEIIGCRNQIWRLTGDPSYAADLSPLSMKVGISGKDALEQLGNGLVAGHSPDGLLMIGESGEPENLSMQVLTEGIQIAREDVDSYLVQVRQDPGRHLIHVFLTLTTRGDSPTVYFTLCERTAGRGPGGIFAMTLPAAMGPTASCLWRGRLILGTFGGYLVEPDNDAKTDDGTAIDCNIPYLAITQGRGDMDTELHALCIEEAVESPTTDASDVVHVRIFSGLTAQMAYAGTERAKRLDQDAKRYGRPLRRTIRDPVLVVELGNDNLATRSIRVEAVYHDSVPCRRITRQTRGVPGRSVAARPPGDLSYPTTTPDGPAPGPGPHAPVPTPTPMLPGPEWGTGIFFQSPWDIIHQDRSIEVSNQPPSSPGPMGGPGFPGGDIGGPAPPITPTPTGVSIN